MIKNNKRNKEINIIEPKKKKINLTKEINNYSENYYENLLLPILNKLWFTIIYDDKIKCFNILTQTSKPLYRCLTFGRCKQIKEFCDNIYNDIYKILICPINNFNNCRLKLQYDYNFIKDYIIKEKHNALLDTIYDIFFYIDYYASIKKQKYLNVEVIPNSDDESDTELDLFY